jgi:hypothetical protein
MFIFSYISVHSAPQWRTKYGPKRYCTAMLRFLTYFKSRIGCPSFVNLLTWDDKAPKSNLIYDRRSVSQSVSQYVLVSSPLWDLWPDIISCSNVAVWNLRSCFRGAPSLTRRQVGSLQCNHCTEPVTILYCLMWDSPSLESQVLVFTSPRNRVAQLYPWALVSHYVTSYDSQGYGKWWSIVLYSDSQRVEIEKEAVVLWALCD